MESGENATPKAVNSKIEALEYCYELVSRSGGAGEERRAAALALIEGYRVLEERELAKKNLKRATGRNYYIPPGL